MKQHVSNHDCYCGSRLTFADCCQALLEGRQQAQTAEQLMRSRYSAFCCQNQTYILASWHPQQRPVTLDLNNRQQWLGLKIIATQDGTGAHQTGSVEFVARYKINGRAYRLHEVSQFERIDDLWYYTKGNLLES